MFVFKWYIVLFHRWLRLIVLAIHAQGEKNTSIKKTPGSQFKLERLGQTDKKSDEDKFYNEDLLNTYAQKEKRLLIIRRILFIGLFTVLFLTFVFYLFLNSSSIFQ
ncbi:hypothetical protein DMA11_06885 [Marinilabiliaceae bacterium JC017]|nr:hypothetical protein DMA11_06885 [Marinilabiliaceae bacterium JC017]